MVRSGGVLNPKINWNQFRYVELNLFTTLSIFDSIPDYKRRPVFLVLDLYPLYNTLMVKVKNFTSGIFEPSKAYQILSLSHLITIQNVNRIVPD